MSQSQQSLVQQAKERFEAGKKLYDGKSYAAAKATFEELLSLGYMRSESEYYLGLIAMAGGDDAGAMADFEKSVAADPKAADAHFYIAELSVKQENFPKAKEHYLAVRSLQPQNNNIKTKLNSLDAKTRVPTPFLGDIYDDLREAADDKYAQSAVRIIDETRMIDRKLILKAYLGSRLAYLIPLLVCRLVGGPLLNAGYTQVNKAKGDLAFAENPSAEVRKKETAAQRQSRLDRAFAELRQAQDVGSKKLEFGILFLALASALFVSYRLYLKEVRNTRVTVDRGFIVITSGLFSRRVRPLEIYQISHFEVKQTFLNMKTNDGTLILMEGEKKTTEIRGLLKYPELVNLAVKLRSLHLDLRSTSVNKGVMG